jgi:hypothetical protein
VSKEKKKRKKREDAGRAIRYGGLNFESIYLGRWHLRRECISIYARLLGIGDVPAYVFSSGGAARPALAPSIVSTLPARLQLIDQY